MKIIIEITKNAYPAYWVGGGRATNTGNFVTVLNKDMKLKKAIFIKTKGHLSNSTNQALVGLSIGDIIVKATYGRDVSREAFEAGELELTAYKIVNFKENKAEVEKMDFKHKDIPEKCWDGALEYHNRDGSYFVKD